MNRRSSTIASILLVASIGLSPRIPLPIRVPGRVFELRVEDVLLVFFLLVWLLTAVWRGRVFLPRLVLPLAVYASLMTLSTAAAIFDLQLDLVRSTLYLLKEFEYFLLFLLVSNFAASERILISAVKTLLTVGTLNALWASYQALTGRYRSLIVFDSGPAGSVVPQGALLESYGPHLISEASPLSTGAFFMLVFLVALSLFVFSARHTRRGLALVQAGWFGIATGLSFSRVSILASLVGGTIILALTNGRRKIQAGILLVAAGAALLLFAPRETLLERFSIEALLRGIGERTLTIWPLVSQEAMGRVFLGYGKGSLAFLDRLPVDPHNHYIRVFVEGGLLGLLAFSWVLISVLSTCIKVFERRASPLGTAIAAATMASSAGLALAGLLHDVFLPVLPNELWWLLVGLTVMANRTKRALPSPRPTAVFATTSNDARVNADR